MWYIVCHPTHFWLLLFCDINISHGSVATHLRDCGIFYYRFTVYKFPAKSVGERILKIDQYVAKSEAKIEWHFFRTPWHAVYADTNSRSACVVYTNMQVTMLGNCTTLLLRVIYFCILRCMYCMPLYNIVFYYLSAFRFGHCNPYVRSKTNTRLSSFFHWQSVFISWKL